MLKHVFIVVLVMFCITSSYGVHKRLARSSENWQHIFIIPDIKLRIYVGTRI